MSIRLSLYIHPWSDLDNFHIRSCLLAYGSEMAHTDSSSAKIYTFVRVLSKYQVYNGLLIPARLALHHHALVAQIHHF